MSYAQETGKLEKKAWRTVELSQHTLSEPSLAFGKLNRKKVSRSERPADIVFEQRRHEVRGLEAVVLEECLRGACGLDGRPEQAEKETAGKRVSVVGNNHLHRRGTPIQLVELSGNTRLLSLAAAGVDRASKEVEINYRSHSVILIGKRSIV